jgi:tRNA (adenine37-N6)-methyltransferase
MSLLSRLRGSHSKQPETPTAGTVTYEVIGVVSNSVPRSQTDGWEGVESEIFLRESLVPGLEGLEGFSHVIVVFHLDQVPEKERRLRVTVGNEEHPPQRGVLATRSQRRPNPLGVSVVQLLGREGAKLRVRGLDALDGSPVLDVKPYLPEYDAVPVATVPWWARR